jgi:hypothetical protein
MFTGRVGYPSALAIREAAGSAAVPAAKCKNLRRGSFIDFSSEMLASETME